MTARRCALLADERGATAVLVALTLSALMGFVALGLDATTGLLVQRRLQAAADAAALAGVLALRASDDPATAARAVAAHGAGLGARERVIVDRPTSPDDPAAVSVLLEARRPALTGLFGGNDVAVRAVARLEPGPPACVLALAATPGAGLDPATERQLRLHGCGVIAATPGLGGARLADADPWRDVPLPPSSRCDTRATLVRGAVIATAGTTPFHFCGGLAIAPGGTLRLLPGRYRVSGGPLLVAPGARLEADGATILLAPDSGMDVAPGSLVQLRAPASGSLQGLALAAEPGRGPPVALAGGAGLSIVGAVRLPQRPLTAAIAGDAPCTQIIAERIVAAGPIRLAGGCDGLAPPIRDRVARLME